MKRILLIGLVVAGLAVVGYAIPVLAHGPEGTGTTTTNQDTWEAMYEACWNGDWEAMDEIAEAMHGEGYGYMPHHSEGYHTPEAVGQAPDNHWGGMWDHMGGGMMNW
jgi:hypothetical protein